MSVTIDSVASKLYDEVLNEYMSNITGLSFKHFTKEVLYALSVRLEDFGRRLDDARERIDESIKATEPKKDLEIDLEGENSIPPPTWI